MRKRNNLRTYISKVIADSNTAKKTKYVDNFCYCEYNEKISEKFYKFLDLGLRLNFDINNEGENIMINLNLLDYDKNVNNNHANSNTILGFNEDFVTFLITKTHFKISKNHMEVCGYKDPFIYDLYKDKIKQFYERKSEEVFHKTIDNIMDTIPAIGREYKIDEIFND
jgi:hypothetical protein